MQTTMRAIIILVVSFIFYEQQYYAITKVIDATTIFKKQLRIHVYMFGVYMFD